LLWERAVVAFSILQQRVLNRLIDAPSNVQSDVPTYINLAIRDLMNDTNFPVMKAVTSMQTTLNTRLLGTLPADYKERRGEGYWLDGEGKPTFTRWYTSHEGALFRFAPQELKNPAITITDQGQPEILTTATPVSATGSTVDGPQNVEVWPLPDGNGFDINGATKVYTIYIPYWRYLAPLALTTDTNWFTENGEQYIMYQALGHGFLADWDEQRASTQFAMAKVYRDKLVHLASNEAASPLKNMSVRSDVFAERDQWRRS
jgi:hypothetical protein